MSSSLSRQVKTYDGHGWYADGETTNIERAAGSIPELGSFIDNLQNELNERFTIGGERLPGRRRERCSLQTGFRQWQYDPWK